MNAGAVSAAGVAAGVLLASGAAFAQGVNPTLVVAFVGVSTSVPLNPWASGAAALAIALVAGAIFRRWRVGRAVRPGLWLAAIAAVAGAAIGAFRFDAIPSAHAGVAVIPLSSSPASLSIGSAFGTRDLSAQNVTGQSIRIVSVDLNDPAPNEQIQTPPTTCVPGLVLGPGQSCSIRVINES